MGWHKVFYPGSIWAAKRLLSFHLAALWAFASQKSGPASSPCVEPVTGAHQAPISCTPLNYHPSYTFTVFRMALYMEKSQAWDETVQGFGNLIRTLTNRNQISILDTVCTFDIFSLTAFLGICFNNQSHFLKAGLASLGSAGLLEVLSPPAIYSGWTGQAVGSLWAFVVSRMWKNGLSLKRQTAERVGYNIHTHVVGEREIPISF